MHQPNMYRISKQLEISEAIRKSQDRQKVIEWITAIVNELDDKTCRDVVSKTFLQFKSYFNDESIDRLHKMAQTNKIPGNF